MGKIGILTFYNAQNYGATLQAFALQEKITEWGYEAEHLRFLDRIYKQENSSFFHKLIRVFEISDGHLLKYHKTKKIARETHTLFKSFRDEYLHISREAYYDNEDLKRSDSKYMGFVTGSDMVWSDIGQNLEAYFLTFTDYQKRIAYAPSITGTNKYSDKKNAEMKNLINGISMLSVREKTGVDYIKRITGREAFWALDPAFLLTKEEWIEKLSILRSTKASPYILVYMFDGSKKIEKAIKEFAQNHKLTLRYIPMNVEERFNDIRNGFPGIYGPKEFVELFINASFVITNSFHGLVFSIISKVPFALIHRGNKNTWHEHENRMSSVLGLFGLNERYIDGFSGIPDSFATLDYKKIDLILQNKINESKIYLFDSLKSLPLEKNKTIKEFYKTIDGLSAKDCTGCTACVNICPRNAIKMCLNAEGFLYPKIENDKCCECSLCIKHCHVLNPFFLNKPQMVYGGYLNDIRRKSSASGGIFFSLAEKIISEGGIVFGACLTEQTFECKHISVNNLNDLKMLQNSKYIQSDLNESFKRIKEYLEDNRLVLFSGTPCQVAGLIRFLDNKEYNNLYTVEIICHGVPSPEFWKWNIKRLKNKGIVFDSITFRNKDEESKTRSRYQLKLMSNGIAKAHFSVREDPYYNSFMEGMSYRWSCYYCNYAKPERCSDISIGDLDSWRLYEDFSPEIAKSLILLNSNKGITLFDKIKNQLKIIPVDYEKECKINHQLCYPSEKSSFREVIYSDLISMSEKTFYKKYTPAANKKEQAKKMVKKILHR